MESRKHRPTLRSSMSTDAGSTDVKNQLKRRISFSGKNCVRIFSEEEEAEAWKNSYEISDGDAGAKSVSLSSGTKNFQNAINGSQSKENIDQNDFRLHSQMQLKEKGKDKSGLTTNNNISVLSSDFLRVSDQNTEVYQIRNSIDITLNDNEKWFQIENVKKNDKMNTNEWSFLLQDDEKEDHSIGEKTVELRKDETNEIEAGKKMCDLKSGSAASFFKENIFQDSYSNIICNKSTGIQKESATTYINESIYKEHNSGTNITADKRKTINQSTAMSLSHNNTQQFAEEYVNPYSMQFANETLNSCRMEIEELPLADSQFNQHFNGFQFHPTIYLDQKIEASSRNMNESLNINKSSKPIEFSPNISTKKNIEKKILSDNFNQTVELDKQSITVSKGNKYGAVPKIKSRSTIHFNQSLDTSQTIFKTDVMSKTMDFDEDVLVSPVKISLEYGSSKISHDSGSLGKYGHQPQLVFRKICTPFISKTKQEQNVTNKSLEQDKADKINQSLSFSLDSTKNMFLSPNSSSHLRVLPLEYKGYTLKQLNDEIERGNIRVFSNGPKTVTNRWKNSQSIDKNTRILLFEDGDMPVSSNQILQSNFKTFNANNDLNDNCDYQEYNRKWRCSQADDMMLDNTIFLTRPKLSDETGFHNSSKTDVTQKKDAMNIFSESIAEDARVDGEGTVQLGLQVQKSSNKENNTFSNMLQNTIPLCTQTVPNTKCLNNSMNLNDTMDISKDIETHHERDVDEKWKKTVRKTVYFNNDIAVDNNLYVENENFEKRQDLNAIRKSLQVPLQNSLMEVEDNCQESKSAPGRIDETVFSLISARKALHFENKIEFEEGLKTVAQKDMQNDEANNNFRIRNITNIMLPINNEIPFNKKQLTTDTGYSCTTSNSTEESILNENLDLRTVQSDMQKKVSSENTDELSSDLNPTKKTMYFNYSIPLKNTSLEITENIQNGNTDNKNENQFRNTIYFNKEISIETASNAIQPGKHSSIDAKNTNPSQKTLYFDNDSCEFLETYTTKSGNERCEISLINSEQKKFQDNKEISANRFYTGKEISFETESIKIEEEHGETGKHCKDSQNLNPLGKTLYIVNKNSEFEETHSAKSKNEKDNKSEIFSEHEIFADSEISPNQSLISCNNYVLPELTPLNAAKFKLLHQMKLSSKQEDDFMTPTKFTCSNKKRALFCITPRLSLLEFEELEKEARVNVNKRPPHNITPTVSMSKKRHTLVFDETNNEEPEALDKHFNNTDGMKISGIVPNDSVIQTWTQRREFRYPICGLEINNSLPLVGTSSNDHDEMGDQLNEEECNIAESIQLVRKATTFTQIENTSSAQLGLDPKLVPSGKLSMFEGNPITVSDVTVFFEAQRKNSSYISQLKGRLSPDNLDSCEIKSRENAKKNLDNRFLNLTLEELDKTRLCLVQLSYEDRTTNVENFEQRKLLSPKNYEAINEKVENIPEVRRNYVSNKSMVCQKCKHCQQMILNESSASSYQSFVWPELPPIPDIGLDTLRRLRKLPTIAHANVFWKRLSLDHTIVNINILDEIVDLGESEDNTNDAAKLLNKIKQYMISFEMKLQGKQNKAYLEDLSFVMRLDSLLRTNSTNWIFDYQMQRRSILLFTHKKMLTFTLWITYDEEDYLGHDISIRSVELRKGHVSKKNWKPIDFFLDFELKLNLPYNIQWLCKGSDAASILKMLKDIDEVCLETIKMGNSLQLVCFTNNATIVSDESGTYVRKVARRVVKNPNNCFKFVDKTLIKVELLNLNRLSFANIVSPQLHLFREDIHLLPTGLQFLKEFLPNPLYYLKDN